MVGFHRSFRSQVDGLWLPLSKRSDGYLTRRAIAGEEGWV